VDSPIVSIAVGEPASSSTVSFLAASPSPSGFLGFLTETHGLGACCDTTWSPDSDTCVFLTTLGGPAALAAVKLCSGSSPSLVEPVLGAGLFTTLSDPCDSIPLITNCSSSVERFKSSRSFPLMVDSVRLSSKAFSISNSSRRRNSSLCNACFSSTLFFSGSFAPFFWCCGFSGIEAPTSDDRGGSGGPSIVTASESFSFIKIAASAVSPSLFAIASDSVEALGVTTGTGASADLALLLTRFSQLSKAILAS